MEVIVLYTMTQTNADTQTHGSLGTALSSLSTSADGLSTHVTDLQEVVRDLQQSTDRLSESQAGASKTLFQAAESLSPQPHTAPDPTPQPSSPGYSAADD